jgi:ABC-type sugar transport system ATPase subunit
MTTAPTQGLLSIQSLGKEFGKTQVLNNLSMEVDQGSFFVMTGMPSSGKSVLLRIILGLESPTSGRIVLRGKDVTDAGPEARNIGYVPQSFALFPNWSVRKNITYPMRMEKASKAAIAQTLDRVCELLGITDLLDKKPNQLSGGQKQRVAIARGLAKQTDFFVLDDPLVGLDFKLRERLIDDLRRTRSALGVTFLYSTSDALEALLLASAAGILSEGTVVEQGPLEQVYDSPQTAATMQTLGFPQANFFEGQLLTAGAPKISTPFGEFEAEFTEPVADGPVLLGIRPEHLLIHGDRPAGSLPSRVLFTEDVGGSEIIYLESEGINLVTVLGADSSRLAAVQSGDVHISLRTDEMVVFDTTTRRRIGHGKELARG